MNSDASGKEASGPLPPTVCRLFDDVRNEAVFLLDRVGRIASWNPGVGSILGWAEDEWIGRPLQVIYTPEDVRSGVPQDELRQAADSGCADDDRWMQRRDGERFFAVGSTSRLLDDQGRLAGYLKMLRDSGALKEAEDRCQRLLAAERRFSARAENQDAALTTLLDVIADGVCIGDARGIRRCNAAALKLLGAGPVSELRGGLEEVAVRFRLRRERDGPLLEPDDLPFARAARGESAQLDLWATQAASGVQLCMRWTAAPIRVEGQGVVGVVAVASDLTERLRLRQQDTDLRRVQRVLDERDAELRALVDRVREYAIFKLDPEGRISSWHPGAALMNGYDADEAIGTAFEQLFSAEDRVAARPARELQIAATTGECKGEGRRLRKDGSTFEAAVVLTALRGPGGELLGFLTLTQDITERKRLERERDATLRDAEQARRGAERVSHSKDEFLATISHELRTPLSAILGWAQVLERGLSDHETVRHGLAAISRNARTQVRLIEDLLDINRIEAGMLRLDLQRIELGGVIAEAVDSALPAATTKGIGLRTVYEPAVAAVMGDATRLKQVMANLLDNAIKFTPAGGQVNVALMQREGHAQVDVADSGQGIEGDFLSRLFDRFQQEDATTTRRHGGLGFGLSIVRHLVQLHDGQMRASSPGVGMGATFTVMLPTVSGHGEGEPQAPASVRPELQAPGAAEAEARLDGVTVLVVDDEPDVIAVAVQVLQQAGARVLAAVNAEDGYALLRRHRPTVLLSDIGMPAADGYELIRRVRDLPAHEGGRTPAVAITAYARFEDRQRALAAGFQLHLAKPLPPSALVAAVVSLSTVGASDHH